ncbi:MAG: GNAT family N-acetyltransferase [Burkholderiaceae bacterium]|nr:GNAT family N-acetyltransferase [Burkholderiaceae bacterium]
MSALRLQAIENISEVEAVSWDALVAASGGSVLSQHAFLQAFETSQSVAPDTGWQPRHLLLWEDEQLVAAIPLYAKGHSYGEFVFDWAWAEAYQRNGLEYYPKWLSAIPFTPVPGSRLLTTEPYRAFAAAALLQWAKKSGLSSLHVLYTTPEDTEALVQTGCMRRTHTQFHWFNRDWPDFDTFLASLTQPKRKKIRAERRKVREAGVTTCVRSGAQITSEDWAFFYRCYANTYHVRGNTPYLTPEFFLTVGETLSEHCVMAIATRRDQPIAASLLWLDTVEGQRKLYGRYWGALEHVDCLHFELAYYTPLEWALANNIAVVEGGAQGEHKLARGFEPVQTQSVHWLAHPGFADAVEKFLERERAGVDNYLGSLSSPFRGEIGD